MKKSAKTVKRSKASRTSPRKRQSKRKPAKSRIDRPLHLAWGETVSYATMVTRAGGQKLGLFIVGNPLEGYTAGALAVKGRIDSIHDVLDHHAHHVIGEDYRTAHVAMAASEEYAGKWMRRELSEIEDCECVDIENTIGQGVTVGPWAPGVPDVPGSSIHNPLFVNTATPKSLIEHARVCVDKATGILIKNSYGATGVPWTPPPTGQLVPAPPPGKVS
jgi:hypothetical protein